jgi:stage II sporulation protein D
MSVARLRGLVLALLLGSAITSCAPTTPVPQTTGAPPQSTPSTTTSPGTVTGSEVPAAGTSPGIAIEPSIEVGLAWDVDTLVLRTTQRGLTYRSGGGHDRSAGRAQAVEITVDNGRARLRALDQASQAIVTPAPAETLWIGEPADGLALAEPQIGWNGKNWRGQAKVFLNPRGKLTLALRLPLESYLLGVVPGEIGPITDAQIEAGRAQAIAARSYTLYYRGRRGTEGFDLYGTVEDQVYGPIESERPIATRCVQSTRGEVALYDRLPIRANYYSTCGGITADVWEAFPATGFPYLESRRDAEGGADYCAKSSLYRWREEWDAATFMDVVSQYATPEGIALPGQGLGTLVDVRVASRSRSGRVWVLEIVTTTGTVRIPAYSIRRVLRRPNTKGAILRSNLFKIDVRRDPATRRALAVVASGAGSGHGAGLCQTGAIGMASAGRSADRILDHYYPGITLDHLYH